jgi:hypothetical protein
MSSADSSTSPITLSDLIAAYNRGPGNTAYLIDISRALELIVARDEEEDSESSDFSADIASLYRLVNVNTKEILNLNRLLALLIFELIEQGIEIQSKELLTELKTYLKNGI